MAEDSQLSSRCMPLAAVIGRLGAASQMSRAGIGAFPAEHQEMVHDLITGEWSKKWLNDVEMTIEEHHSTPSLRVFRCRKKRQNVKTSKRQKGEDA